MASLMGRHKGIERLVLLAALALYLLQTIFVFGFLIDDSFIFFQYAKNLAGRTGLVFNVGQRVEGYSSFIWVILLAPFAAAEYDLVLPAKVLGVVFGCATIFMMWWFATLENDGSLLRVGAVIFLAASLPFAVWAVSGMDTALTAFLWLTATYCFARGQQERRYYYLSAVLAAVVGMTRPEGPLLFGVLFLILVTRTLTSHTYNNDQRKGIFAWVAIFALIFVPWFLWRWNYYGYFFPNTVYLKAGGGYLFKVLKGIYYAYLFSTSGAGVLFWGIAGLSIWSIRENPRIIVTQLVTISYVLFIVVAGGDWMPLSRFFVHVLPLVFLLVGEGMEALYRAMNRQVVNGFGTNVVFGLLYVVIAIALLLEAFVTVSINRLVTKISSSTDNTIRMAEWLRERAPFNAVIAVNDAGALGYYSGLKTIDMAGLLDTHIAHLVPVFPKGINPGNAFGKWDTNYVLALKPDFVQLHVTRADICDRSFEPGMANESELYNSPEFRNFYQYVEAPQFYGLFQRRSENEVRSMPKTGFCDAAP